MSGRMPMMFMTRVRDHRLSKPFSAGSTSIRRRCASAARRSTSLRHHQGQDGSNPFSDEDAATS